MLSGIEVIVAVGASLVVGALVAWLVRGSELKRLRRLFDDQRQAFENELANHRLQLQSAQTDGASARDEVELAREQRVESEEEWGREREVSRQLLGRAESRIDRLSAELGQLREQLGQTHRDVALQKQTNLDLEEQLSGATDREAGLAERLESVTQELVRATRERDAMGERQGTGPVDPPGARRQGHRGHPKKRRWRIATFFEG